MAKRRPGSDGLAIFLALDTQGQRFLGGIAERCLTPVFFLTWTEF